MAFIVQIKSQRTLKLVAAVVSVLLCVTPAYFAVRAWIAHFEWLAGGDYHRNSFPASAFANDMTWVAAAVTLVVVAAWGVAWRFSG
jgi:hypothetical protein